MSVATLPRGGLSGSKSRRVKPPPWERPADWLPLPVVNPGEQKLVGLHAVFDHDSNFVAFTVTGAYTVDWGDGSAPENIAGATAAFHKYDFAAIPAGTLTSDGFKQVVVTVTMQGAANLTVLNLTTKHNQAGLANGYTAGWLDIRIAGQSLGTLTIQGAAPSVGMRLLRQFEYVGVNNAGFSGSNLFNGCVALQSVIGTAWTANVTTFLNMFSGCASLRTIPRLDTAKGTTFDSMFATCRSLVTIPAIDTSKGTSFASMFLTCQSLVSVPMLDTHLGVSFSSCFSGCTAVQSLPLWDTGASNNFATMLSSCFALRSVPLYNLAGGAAGGSCAGMLQNCFALETVPAFDTSRIVNFSNMFAGCTALIAIPPLDTSAGTNFATMFNGCTSLQAVPLLNVANCASAANMAGIFTSCAALAKGALAGQKFTVIYSQARLSAAELNNIYTNLAVAVGQTITVTGNYGTSGDDPTIATAKGWTVTGS